MDAHGISAKQLLASMGGVHVVDGKQFKITKLVDVDTGLEIT